MSLVDDEKILEFKEDFLIETNKRYSSQSTFTAGSKGLVPAPTSEDISKGSFLRADGNWYSPFNITSWSQGTDQDIVTMIEAADAGIIDLKDYWSVGDERVVSLSAMPESDGVYDSHTAQNVKLILMDIDNPNYEYVTSPSSGETHCRFIVGMKDVLGDGHSMGNYQYGRLHLDYYGNGWDGCRRRVWCNNTFRNSIPSTLRSIFKQVKVKTMNTIWSSLTISNDYFFLPTEKEIYGIRTYSANDEANILTQFEYYKNSSNRRKANGYNNQYYSDYTLLRSTLRKDNRDYTIVINYDSVNHINTIPTYTDESGGISVCGCI